MGGLQLEDPAAAARTAVQLIQVGSNRKIWLIINDYQYKRLWLRLSLTSSQALEEAKEFHQLEANLQVQFISQAPV